MCMIIKYISFTEKEIKEIEAFRQINSISTFSGAVRMMLFPLSSSKLDEILVSVKETNKLIKNLKDHIAPFAPME